MSYEKLRDERDQANKGNFTRPVIFTLAELWLLNDMIRHGVSQADAWKYPPAAKELNQEIALSIVACVDGRLKEFTLELSEGDMLVIDYNIRRDMKDAKKEATGQEILLKVFRALQLLAMGFRETQTGQDIAYTEVSTNASTDADTDENAD